MIPKTFHRIWLGGSMPEEFIYYGETWKTHNPGWELKLWTEANLTTRYPDLVKRCWKYRHEANIYRYELLLQEGGVYIDTDFECLRPIGPLIEDMNAFVAYQLDEPSAEGAINNALFGSVPGSFLLEDVVAHIPDVFDEKHPFNCGPPYFTKVIQRHPEVRLFPRWYFYPYLWHELGRKGEAFKDAYAVHHWSSLTKPEVDSRKKH
jgi:inositol phosphorylceramide mannosyltransferase catalytic subunit